MASKLDRELARIRAARANQPPLSDDAKERIKEMEANSVTSRQRLGMILLYNGTTPWKAEPNELKLIWHKNPFSRIPVIGKLFAYRKRVVGVLHDALGLRTWGQEDATTDFKTVQPNLEINKNQTSDFESSDQKPLEAKLTINWNFDMGTDFPESVRVKLANKYVKAYENFEDFKQMLQAEIETKLGELIKAYKATSAINGRTQAIAHRQDIENALRGFLTANNRKGAISYVKLPGGNTGRDVVLSQLDLPKTEKERISQIESQEKEERRMVKVLADNILVITQNVPLKQYCEELSQGDPVVAQRIHADVINAARIATFGNRGSAGGGTDFYNRSGSQRNPS